MASTSGEAELASNVTGAGKEEEEQGGTETSYEQKVAVICILSVLSVFGTIGNGLVLYVFNSKGNKLKPEYCMVTSTIFILALAWTDIFTCSVIIPLTIVLVARDSDLLCDFMCKMYHFCITFNVPLSAFIMVAIAVDRYFSICHPFMHAVTPKRARLTVFFLTIFAFTLGTVVALAYGYVLDPQSANVTAGINHSAPASFTTPDPRTLRPWPAGSALKDILAGDPAGQGNIAAATMTSAGQTLGGSTTTLPTAAIPSSVRRICLPTEDIIAMEFLEIYQKFYAGVFLVSLIAVLIIYALIYHSVVKRREWRRRQRSGRPASKSQLTQHTELETETLELRTKNGALTPAPPPSTNGGGGGGGGGGDGRTVTVIVSSSGNGCCSEMQSLNSSEKKASKERRDFNFLANIRTAAMLFVVTLVFIICFLPSWLMAIKLFNFNAVVFYMYFLYNAANPVIYAFMNHAFRKELKRVFQRGLSICSS